MIETVLAPPPPVDTVGGEDGGASRFFLDCRGRLQPLDGEPEQGGDQPC